MDELAATGDLDALRERATSLAAAWGAAAAAVTTVGQERAILRLFGVAGIDRSGVRWRPRSSTVLRLTRNGSGRIALPFAMAMAEYDLGPHDSRSGAAATWTSPRGGAAAEPDRRAIALPTRRGRAPRWTAWTRTARAARAARAARGPAAAVAGRRLLEPAIVDALDEAAIAWMPAWSSSAEVPPSRELADLAGWPSRSLAQGHPRAGPRRVRPVRPAHPDRSRALAVLRRFVDEGRAVAAMRPTDARRWPPRTRRWWPRSSGSTSWLPNRCARS
jgi:hypothetical protein